MREETQSILIIAGLVLGVFNLVNLFRHNNDIKDLKFLLCGATKKIEDLKRNINRMGRR